MWPAQAEYSRSIAIMRNTNMKTAILLTLAVVTLVASGCSVRGHANRSSTGAGFSTPVVGASGAIRY
ncbi:hypothetical protein AYO49_03095 [Verrucomicrobiaceae bacterium SCGC AG-212-N21]|nr:hypothetical protein AYO49_03095 [Verrucomicrobiaceae bacterium SCGC AG-212-N21]